MSAHAQSSVTLYGVIATGLTYSSNQQGHSSWQETSAATENTVFGLKGSEDLGGGSHAIFKLENGFNLNNGSSFNTSDAFGEQAYIGLQSDQFGTLLIGRQYDTLNDVLGPISAAGGTYGGNMAAHPFTFNNDNLAADSMSINNAVKYTSISYSGLSIEGMYALSNPGRRFFEQPRVLAQSHSAFASTIIVPRYAPPRPVQDGHRMHQCWGGLRGQFAGCADLGSQVEYICHT
jgi:predicted porin